jgi:hypothetical protein
MTTWMFSKLMHFELYKEYNYGHIQVSVILNYIHLARQQSQHE